MKIHRFYIGRDHVLKQDFWLQNDRLLNQWRKVLRFQPGQELVLFDGVEHDRLYKLVDISDKEAHLSLVTEYKRQVPKREIYLFWALLKNDKNDWVLQKCTELGVSHFVPILTERSEKQGLRLERAEKILVEAAEQSGRSDIPNVREPMLVSTALEEFKEKLPLYICEQTEDEEHVTLPDSLGVFIGPEGGWSNAEKALFKAHKMYHINLGDFTLRAETAAISAVVASLR